MHILQSTNANAIVRIFIIVITVISEKQLQQTVVHFYFSVICENKFKKKNSLQNLLQRIRWKFKEISLFLQFLNYQ